MRLRVDSCLHLERAQVSEKMLAKLGRAFSFPNPVYLSRVRLGLFPGDEPERISVVTEDEKEIRLPRGAIHTLRNIVAQENLTLEIEDRRMFPRQKLPLMPGLALRDYQKIAVEKVANVTQGLVIMPCGSGKTASGIGAIARLRTPTLILVHTHDLAEQWREQLKP